MGGDAGYTQGECENYMMIKGHKLAVTDVHWTTDGQTLVTSGADKTLRAFDALTSKQIKKMVGHSSFVNACCPARRHRPTSCPAPPPPPTPSCASR